MTLSETQLAAERATRAQEWSQAASLWERVYQHEQSAPVNYQLVRALVADQQFVAAASYARESEAQYLAADVAADVYLAALIGKHEFISARIVIKARQQSTRWTATACATLSAAETQAEQQLQATLTTTMRQFYHLSDQPVVSHAERLQAARHLTYQRYLTAAKFLLVDPFLHPLTRVEVLYTLYELRVPDEVQMRWLFDERRLTIRPAELLPLGTDTTSIATQHALKAQLGNQDVFLYENLRELLQLQLMYLYPQPGLVISDPTAWVTVLIGQQTGNLPTGLTERQMTIVKIQQKIQQFSLDLQQ
mgnify:CR=1 FL=1